VKRARANWHIPNVYYGLTVLVRNRTVFSGLIELFVFSWRIIKLMTKTPSFYDLGFLTVAQVTNVSFTHARVRIGVLCVCVQLPRWNKSCCVYCLSLVESHPSWLDITTECVTAPLNIKDQELVGQRKSAVIVIVAISAFTWLLICSYLNSYKECT